jgi:starvation-inducible DNA-binding protein
VLADSYQLMIKTQGVHWNVAGPAFYSIHKLTEEHYNNLFEAH